MYPKKRREKDSGIKVYANALTERIPQPVGMNAKMQANMSMTESSVKMMAIATPRNASTKETPCISRSNSWKFTDAF